MNEEQNNPTSKSEAEHLKKLFEFVTPRDLRKNVMKAFFVYVLEQDNKGFLDDFKTVVEDHYFLIDFLDKIEELNKLNSL
jgi:hypothetical protein